MLVFPDTVFHSITNHKISVCMMLSLCFDWSSSRIKKIGEDLTLLPWGFLQSFQLHFGLLVCSLPSVPPNLPKEQCRPCLRAGCRMRAGSCLPVWRRRGGARSSTSSPSPGQPGRRWRDRGCRTWTQPTLRTSALSSSCLHLLPHNCSSRAEVAQSRAGNKSKQHRPPAGPCGNRGCACGTGWECCSARRTAPPGRSGTPHLQGTKQQKCLLPLFCMYPFQIPRKQVFLLLFLIYLKQQWKLFPLFSIR